MSNMLRVVAGVLMFGSVIFAQEYEPGKVVPEIRCKGASDYSYLLYLPKNYDPSREAKWPVLFVMSPMGGSEKWLQRYIPGSDKCGWIVAMSVQSKNDNDGAVSHNAITAMVDDVFKRVPVDKERCYASGFSGGARESFWLANRMQNNIIGLIPCGAGDYGNPVNGRVLAYGLSGATCFNRWDTTITFNRRIKERGVHRFFAGVHQWAEAPYLLDAMVWLNGKYLSKDGGDEERAAFSNMLLADVKENREKKPVFAYELCKVLSDMKKAPDAAEAKALLPELEEIPAVQTHIDAQEDIAEFADKYFNTSVMDYLNKRTTPESEKASQNLTEKYKGTPYEALMKGLGQLTQDWSNR